MTLTCGPFLVEFPRHRGNGLHLWIEARGVHIFWRNAGLNQPVRSVGPLRFVPARLDET